MGGLVGRWVLEDPTTQRFHWWISLLTYHFSPRQRRPPQIRRSLGHMLVRIEANRRTMFHNFLFPGE